MADIGAGSGLFTLPFADKVGSQGRVYAVDIVPAFLERIRQRAADTGHPSVQTVLATERSVELPLGSIDLAFICDTYHHFEYPKHAGLDSPRAQAGGGAGSGRVQTDSGGEHRLDTQPRARREDVFTREIEAAGFRKIGREDFLKENYLLRFRRTDVPEN